MKLTLKWLLCCTLVGTLGFVRPAFTQETGVLGGEAGEMSAEKLRQFAEILVEKYRDCWSLREVDCFLQLYTSDAEIYRNLVLDGREVDRRFYHGEKDIMAGKLSKTYLRTGTIKIDFSDMEAFAKGGHIYILFKQDFQNFSPQGALVYHDEIIKFIVMKLVKGNWAVSFEDSLAFRPGEYQAKREEAKERFLPKFGESKEEKFEAIQMETGEKEEAFQEEGAPTPSPTPSTIPSPTPTPTPVAEMNAIIFRALHEVSGKPLPEVKADVTTTRHEIIDTFYSGDDGLVKVPKAYAANEKYFENYIYLYLEGFDIASFYKFPYKVGVIQDVPMILVKPLIIEQQPVIQAGQTLQDLAQFYYHAAVYWKEILHHNNQRITSDTDLPAGEMITLPPVSVLKEYKRQTITMYYVDSPVSNLHQVTVKFFGASGDAPSLGTSKPVELVENPTGTVAGYQPGANKLYKVTLPPRLIE